MHYSYHKCGICNNIQIVSCLDILPPLLLKNWTRKCILKSMVRYPLYLSHSIVETIARIPYIWLTFCKGNVPVYSINEDLALHVVGIFQKNVSDSTWLKINDYMLLIFLTTINIIPRARRVAALKFPSMCSCHEAADSTEEPSIVLLPFQF
jgi:hypothetical protein